MQNDLDITKLRKLNNWTQGDLAKEFGVNKSTVWRWENEGIPDRGPARAALERLWSSTARTVAE